ncbi:MAG TPA: diacylglycerol kinase family lipid kinase [Thermoanaerobacterales bacterium]|nr:diacylglycerol kinase family lipid kinase [Thermoanaerobacterales bacterium]
MKTLFIINPIAGRNKSKIIWNDIKSHINIPFDYVFTQMPGDARRFAHDAYSQGFKRVVAVGGDGTVSEVVNGIVGSDLELGIIPAGTGNDFVKTLNIPLTPKEALTVIETGKTTMVDLGKSEKGFFINVAGAGFDAEVVNTTNVDIKFLTGTPAYVSGLIINLVRYSPREAQIEIDGEVYHRKLWLIVVANGQYFGGGMKISPDAVIDDGLFDICMVNSMSRLEILRFLPKVFTGAHKTHPALEVIRGRNIKIDFKTPTKVQADGEVIGNTPVSFSIVSKALKVIRNNFTSA